MKWRMILDLVSIIVCLALIIVLPFIFEDRISCLVVPSLASNIDMVLLFFRLTFYPLYALAILLFIILVGFKLRRMLLEVED